MSILPLSQEMIRLYATSKSWQRGEAYYHDGYVRRVVQRGNSIAAEVEGNDIRPYQVSIGFDGEELGTVYCSCPYDYGGCCKHIVAKLDLLQKYEFWLFQRLLIIAIYSL